MITSSHSEGITAVFITSLTTSDSHSVGWKLMSFSIFVRHAIICGTVQTWVSKCTFFLPYLAILLLFHLYRFYFYINKKQAVHDILLSLDLFTVHIYELYFYFYFIKEGHYTGEKTLNLNQKYLNKSLHMLLNQEQKTNFKT